MPDSLRAISAATDHSKYRHVDRYHTSMDLQLDDDTALVTASSSGLGKASAKALVREGANVVINGRDEERLEAARKEMRPPATVTLSRKRAI